MLLCTLVLLPLLMCAAAQQGLGCSPCSARSCRRAAAAPCRAPAWLWPPPCRLTYSLQARLVWGWNLLLLPAVAGVQGWHSQPLCRRIVGMPGADRSMGALYTLVTTAQ